MALLQRSAWSAWRRCLEGTRSSPTLWKNFATASSAAPEAGARANEFSLGDTGGVPKEEYADTFPDAYIMKVFKHQQESYRRYLDGLKDVKIPQSPEGEEFANYVKDMEKIKAESGLPTALDLSGAQMVTMAVEANGSFRRFLELAAEGADTEAQSSWDLIWQALDEVESSHGPVPISGDNKAAQAFSQKMKDVASKVQKDLGPSLMNEVIQAYRSAFQEFRAGQVGAEAGMDDDLEEELGDDWEDDLEDGLGEGDEGTSEVPSKP